MPSLKSLRPDWSGQCEEAFVALKKTDISFPRFDLEFTLNTGVGSAAYLWGHPFLVRTDHSALHWWTHFKDPNGQVARWLDVRI